MLEVIFFHSNHLIFFTKTHKRFSGKVNENFYMSQKEYSLSLELKYRLSLVFSSAMCIPCSFNLVFWEHIFKLIMMNYHKGDKHSEIKIFKQKGKRINTDANSMVYFTLALHWTSGFFCIFFLNPSITQQSRPKYKNHRNWVKNSNTTIQIYG